ncbi:efflux RND transporter periplasmic adaptor subunit [Pseudocolwellia sp. HL-MZ19]|uniref:efflux RND transporter periplasmic adaptor subunit n=1 Tax=Pseudocolwellia sp. HL-MZ19 TaxID=3400846 RepID=UPI003CE99CE9
MKILKNKLVSTIVISGLVLGFYSQANGSESNIEKQKTELHSSHDVSNKVADDHDSHEHNEESEALLAKAPSEHNEGVITLSPQKMALANIKVKAITPKIQYSSIYAPGEIKANGYKSFMVSPRTESVIINRHAILGEHVEKGQKLVTLFSESMAQAQADYLIASTEWQRIKKLGKQTVSESRLVLSETTFNAAYGKLIAFGLTEEAIKDIFNMPTTLFGQYSLTAHGSGVVLQDDFYQGQRVAAGDLVMLLADEDDLWVEAKVSPNKKFELSINSPAIVQFAGHNYKAKVIQEAHTIDPITRTRIIRLSVKNQEDSLHSGMFVKINFQFETQNKVLAVPEEALMRSADGDWIVFVEDHPGEFAAVEVNLGRALGDLREISGLESGSRVVTQGAFFVASEIAKGGFDPHNH